MDNSRYGEQYVVNQLTPEEFLVYKLIYQWSEDKIAAHFNVTRQWVSKIKERCEEEYEGVFSEINVFLPGQRRLTPELFINHTENKHMTEKEIANQYNLTENWVGIIKNKAMKIQKGSDKKAITLRNVPVTPKVDFKYVVLDDKYFKSINLSEAFNEYQNNKSTVISYSKWYNSVFVPSLKKFTEIRLYLSGAVQGVQKNGTEKTLYQQDLGTNKQKSFIVIATKYGKEYFLNAQ